MKESISHTGNRFVRNVTDNERYDTIGFNNDLKSVVASYDTVATTAKKLLPPHVIHA